MKYNIGDKVWVKGEVIDVDPTGDDVKVQIDGWGERWFKENDSSLSRKDYHLGCSDTWTLVRKIENEYEIPVLEQIFGSSKTAYILDNFTAEEVLKRIKDHEQSQQIKVKDVVKLKGNDIFGVVTHVGDDITVLWQGGRCGEYQRKDLVRTGSTAAGLDILLQQIK